MAERDKGSTFSYGDSTVCKPKIKVMACVLMTLKIRCL